MNKIITLFVTLLLSSAAFSQAPELMSYQAVVRDATDNLITSSTVGMQISILQGSPTGTAEYVETQTPSSNQNGLVSIQIGAGTVVSGAFSTIDWANGPYFIKTETDPTGGTSYTITGTSQLMSVPYALSAATDHDWTVNGTDMYDVNRDIGIGTSTPETKLHVDGDLKLVTGNEGADKVLTSDANGNADWEYALTPIKSGYDSWLHIDDLDNYKYATSPILTITPTQNGVIKIHMSGNHEHSASWFNRLEIGYKVTITNFAPNGIAFDNSTISGSGGWGAPGSAPDFNDSWSVLGTYNVVAGVTYYIWLGGDASAVTTQGIIYETNCVVTLHTSEGL